MEPGSGADRLIGTQLSTLPQGNVNGLSYSCEARCGYPDYAADMISCDSVSHRRRAKLRLRDGQLWNRGWYHRGCSGLALDDYPTIGEYICPPCFRRRTTSTKKSSEEGQGDDHRDKHNPNDRHSFEHDHRSIQDAPDECIDDGNDRKLDDDRSNSKRSRRERSPYHMSAGVHNDGGGASGDGTDQVGITVISPNKQGILNGKSVFGAKAPAYITQARDPWIEEEKVLAMKLMRMINREQTSFGEDRFKEIARIMRLRGYNRCWGSVKNAWNRGLRERSGIDERKNRNAPLTTSRQDAATKRENREKKRRSQLWPQRAGGKRKYESHG